MKKVLSVIALIMVMVLLTTAFAACDSKKDDADKEATLEGSYKLTDASGDNAEYYLDIKSTFKLTIDAKNVGDLTISGSSASTLNFDTEKMEVSMEGGATIPYTFNGKVLKIENSSGMMEFTKE